MNIDSYETPTGERLLISGRQRFAERGQAQRILITEAVGAAVAVVGAVSVAAFSTSTRSLSVTAVAVTVVAYLVATRVTFPVGSAWTPPTQVVFVPMLFVLPTPLVPLIVAVILVADLLPRRVDGHLSVTRVLTRLADSFYALGPVLVLVVAGEQNLSLAHWPVLLLAFAAQVIFDSGAGLARSWFAEGIVPSEQLPMVWIYLTDACLSCVGLVFAASAVGRPGLILLALPLMVLFALFARERQQRLDQTLELSSAYRGTALLLGDVVEADDRYTGIHSREVVDLSLGVADALRLDPTRRRNVEFAGLLHDVGKIRIPKEIINKHGELDEAEWAIMRRHTIEGEKMLKKVGGTLSSVGKFVRSTHERYDGLGYPDGIAAAEIPIESRIVAVCDAYNAMTTNRPYRDALSAADAIEELRRCAGSQFDPRVVGALDDVLKPQTSASSQSTEHERAAAATFSNLCKAAVPA
jgi:HD-GYP domain-containing protein (c-di-GMP phosphodiesterase class II)